MYFIIFIADPEIIRAIDERDPRAAVIYLLDELCSNTNTEPGRWKQFIEALERCGKPSVINNTCTLSAHFILLVVSLHTSVHNTILFHNNYFL